MNQLVRALVREARFAPVAPYQRFAYVCGALLLLSGVLHAVVYLVDGGPWEGPLSWRKPIVFGLSFGVSVLTFAWFLGFLRPRRATGWLLMSVLSVASVLEVVLISMQTWRGVESHFNEDTAFDALVFSVMGAMVTLIALVTVYFAVRSFFPGDAPPVLAWAMRIGLVLILASQAVGAQMIAMGGNTFGDAGAMKLPHALALHAVQVLPLLAVLLRVSPMLERRRVQTLCVGASGYVCLVVAAMLQTYRGRGPLELDLGSAAVAALGVALLAACAFVALRGAGSALRRPTGPAPAQALP